MASAALREVVVGRRHSAWRASRGQRVPHHGNRPLRAADCVSQHAGSGFAGD